MTKITTKQQILIYTNLYKYIYISIIHSLLTKTRNIGTFLIKHYVLITVWLRIRISIADHCAIIYLSNLSAWIQRLKKKVWAD